VAVYRDKPGQRQNAFKDFSSMLFEMFTKSLGLNAEHSNICPLNWKQAVREAAKNAPAPCKLTNLLTLKVVSESCVMWASSVAILVYLGLSVLNLGPTYATDKHQTSYRRQTDWRQTRIIA